MKLLRKLYDWILTWADKPSGAKVLASVIVDHLISKKIVTRAYE